MQKNEKVGDHAVRYIWLWTFTSRSVLLIYFSSCIVWILDALHIEVVDLASF